MAYGVTLTASTGTWSGTAPITYSYQWCTSRAASSQGACPSGYYSISGATSASYTPMEAEVGYDVRVVVTASNSVGSASTSSAVPSYSVLALANVSAPTISGTALTGTALTASTGTWTTTPR